MLPLLAVPLLLELITVIIPALLSSSSLLLSLPCPFICKSNRSVDFLKRKGVGRAKIQMKKESIIPVTTIQRELRSHWAAPGVLFSAPARAACCSQLWRTGLCWATALDQSGGKKKELHQPPPVPAKLPWSRFTAELKILFSASEHTCRGAGELPQAPGAPSISGMAGCPHGHGHHEPPATALLSAGSYPFLGQVSCGQGVLQVSAVETEVSFHAQEQRLSSGDPGRAIARGEHAVQVACLIRIDLRSILWTKWKTSVTRKKWAEMAS